MADSDTAGGELIASLPDGKSAGLLGPSDSSDSGSDSIGELGPDQMNSDSDRAGTGERAAVEVEQGGSGADILPDHVVRIDADGNFLEPDADAEVNADVDDDVDVDDEADADPDATARS